MLYVCADADITYTEHEKDQMVALDTLAAHYVTLARSEKNKELKKENFAQVQANPPWDLQIKLIVSIIIDGW